MLECRDRVDETDDECSEEGRVASTPDKLDTDTFMLRGGENDAEIGSTQEAWVGGPVLA